MSQKLLCKFAPFNRIRKLMFFKSITFWVRRGQIDDRNNGKQLKNHVQILILIVNVQCEFRTRKFQTETIYLCTFIFFEIFWYRKIRKHRANMRNSFKYLFKRKFVFARISVDTNFFHKSEISYITNIFEKFLVDSLTIYRVRRHKTRHVDACSKYTGISNLGCPLKIFLSC